MMQNIFYLLIFSLFIAGCAGKTEKSNPSSSESTEVIIKADSGFAKTEEGAKLQSLAVKVTDQYIKNPAEAGDVEAQVKLARIYEKGSAYPQSYEKAAYWFTKAAEGGSTQAHLDLAYYHLHGHYFDKSFEKAAYHYGIAAERGDKTGYFMLGVLYSNGEGVEKNPDKAMSLFQNAAGQGHVHAYLEIGRLYSLGSGVQQDYIEARKWYTKAALQGLPDAINNLGFYFFKGLGGKEDKELGIALEIIAAEKGYALAQEELDKDRQSLASNLIEKADRLAKKLIEDEVLFEKMIME